MYFRRRGRLADQLIETLSVTKAIKGLPDQDRTRNGQSNFALNLFRNVKFRATTPPDLSRVSMYGYVICLHMFVDARSRSS